MNIKRASEMKEKAIEQAVVDYAKARGCLSIKLNSLGVRGSTGWPDRMFIFPHGRVVFFEFKRAGGKATALQEQRFLELQSHHQQVFLVDSAEDGKRLIDELDTP